MVGKSKMKKRYYWALLDCHTGCLLSVWYNNISLEVMPSLGFVHACAFLSIYFCWTLFFPRKYSLGLIQYQQKGSVILWQQLLFLLLKMPEKKKNQSKFSDSFSLTVLEHEHISLTCKSGTGYGSVSEAWRQKWWCLFLNRSIFGFWEQGWE